MAAQLSVQMIPRTLYLLSSVRKFRRTKGFRLSYKRLPAPALCFITKGKGSLRLNDTAHAVEPQQLYYMESGAEVEAEARTRETEYYVIFLEPLTASKRNGRWRLGGDRRPAARLLPPGRIPVTDPAQIQERFEQILRSFQGQAEAHPPDLQLQALLDLLVRESLPQEAVPAANSGIDSCIAYMHHHFREKISRETLADIAGLTPNAFCRSFKRAHGVSPTDYLNRIRINAAKEQLSPGQSVKEVAALVGYGSEYYFSRIFKETVGIAPTLFIKRERLRVATASRTSYQDNLSSIGMEAVAAVDCYRYPEIDDAEYDRRMLSQLEQLRMVKPDLIIGDFFHHPFYEAFKQIAPTVILEHHLDWRVNHQRIAELVGREQEADQTFAQMEERIAALRERFSRTAQQQSVTVMQVVPTRVRIQGTISHPLNELLYEGLGLMPGRDVPRNKMRRELPAEELPALEADHLFLIGKAGIQPEDPFYDKLQEVCFLHFIPNWLFMSWTPPGRNRILDVLENTLGR
ncbi:AraC family transcriptional regulator [Paenibacillus sp. y28]|uniref:AraC family transcriptional regulator n=1 Tax=Paenibacillus sp. y28 TaxID=3129110 RepID=UPI0030177E45